MPLFGIKLGIDLGLAAVSDTPSGKGEIILADSFTPGVLSPVQILASHEGDGALSHAGPHHHRPIHDVGVAG